jgi:NAD(P)-dependent dehydrogenase (short-subunit alcohol dehydrogenase family)
MRHNSVILERKVSNHPAPQTLRGKVALITGASSGIGRATAIELARRGAKVIVSARRGPEIEALVAEIRKPGTKQRLQSPTSTSKQM